MELYLGGYAQGKLAYVRQKKKGCDLVVIDGAAAEQEEGAAFRKPEALSGEQCLVVDHFHLWVRAGIRQGLDVTQLALDYVQRYPDVVIICDEVGNGIVPVEPFEREYRQQLGRLLILLAQQADRVERVICQMGQRLK